MQNPECTREYMRISSTAQRSNHGAQQINRGALNRSPQIVSINIVTRDELRLVDLLIRLFVELLKS